MIKIPTVILILVCIFSCSKNTIDLVEIQIKNDLNKSVYLNNAFTLNSSFETNLNKTYMINLPLCLNASFEQSGIVCIPEPKLTHFEIKRGGLIRVKVSGKYNFIQYDKDRYQQKSSSHFLLYYSKEPLMLVPNKDNYNMYIDEMLANGSVALGTYVNGIIEFILSDNDYRINEKAIFDIQTFAKEAIDSQV
ncbi:hypothetical protein H0R92_10010 [Treponema sp. OMZ 840]|uniref:hypothetical protein n=1 Tax=Treponema sp. OMZ 840 TaxID=244313 RepID=UPI003D8BCE0A